MGVLTSHMMRARSAAAAAPLLVGLVPFATVAANTGRAAAESGTSGGEDAPSVQTSARAADNAPLDLDLRPIAAKAREAGGMPGIVVAVVPRDGSPILAADGRRVATETTAITTDDRMHLGSCTKAMTATLAAVLVAEGTIEWTSTVGEVLDRDARDMDPAWRAVTLEDLLRHRGGAPSDPPAELWSAAFACDRPPIECRATFVRGLLATKPGERGAHSYSNQGYAIAGRMLEIASTRSAATTPAATRPTTKPKRVKPTSSGSTTPIPYEQLLADRVFRPLGIARATFGPPSRTEPTSPKGHEEGGAVRDIDNPSAIAPAGTVAMPLGDWAKFIAFHLGHAPPPELAGAARELANLHRKAASEPFETPGWFSVERPWGGSVLTHAGSNTLWFCVAWLAPEKGFAVLVATNQAGERAAKACDGAAGALIETWQAAQRAKATQAPSSPAPAGSTEPSKPAGSSK